MSKHKEITLPLILGVAGCVIPNLFPTWDVIERNIPYACDYKWLMPMMKTFVGVIVFLAPYAIYHRFVYRSDSREENIHKLKELKTSSVNSSSYIKHKELLLWAKNIKKIIGFDLSLYNTFEKNLSRTDHLFRIGIDNTVEINNLYTVLNQAILTLEDMPYKRGRTNKCTGPGDSEP